MQEPHIYEAIFRYRIEQRHRKGPFFLSINGADPSDEFLARLADMGTPIKKASAADLSKGYLRDNITGEKGVKMNAQRVTWISANRGKVSGGSYCGGRCADTGIYDLEKRGAGLLRRTPLDSSVSLASHVAVHNRHFAHYPRTGKLKLRRKSA